jgi:hypothetical protein
MNRLAAMIFYIARFRAQKLFRSFTRVNGYCAAIHRGIVGDHDGATARPPFRIDFRFSQMDVYTSLCPFTFTGHESPKALRHKRSGASAGDRGKAMRAHLDPGPA